MLPCLQQAQRLLGQPVLLQRRVQARAEPLQVPQHVAEAAEAQRALRRGRVPHLPMGAAIFSLNRLKRYAHAGERWSNDVSAPANQHRRALCFRFTPCKGICAQTIPALHAQGEVLSASAAHTPG